MVKADPTRDYYGDLELQPTADTQEIKKQYMKLARKYHPDRNVGREAEVTAAFQSIQSAYEVLLDTTERAKYDTSRRSAASNFRSSYTGPTSSGVRGNPWANAGSQWAPPPKAPTARKPPPQSAGARRYDKWDTPKSSTNWSGYEGADARTKTYEAWESMKSHNTTSHNTTKPGPERTWAAPKPPPRETPRSGREESNAKTHAPPPKARPGFEEFKNGQSSSTPKRSQSTNARKGFMPNTPGGDEPAAPRGAYFTQRAAPPDPPPRQPQPPLTKVAADPLQQFKNKVPQFEPRLSTPYATHGGEKFDPNGNANINRSKSTRESPSSKHVPRAGSDPNMSSNRRRSATAASTNGRNPTVDLDDSSDDEPIRMNEPFGKPRSSAKATNGTSASSARPQEAPNANQASSIPRKPISNIGKFRQWMKENPGAEPPLNGFPPDGPPLRSDSFKNDKPDESKMYAKLENISFSSDHKRNSNYSVKFPTAADKSPSKDSRTARQSEDYFFTPDKYPNLFPNGEVPTTPPSGVAADPKSLNAFEDMQRNVIDQLLSSKKQSASAGLNRMATEPARTNNGNGVQQSAYGKIQNNHGHWSNYRDPVDTGSPSKKMKPSKILHSIHLDHSSKARDFWQNLEQLKANANHFDRQSRFSFNVDNDTFKRTNSTHNGFTSNSAENISTKFTPEDWTGKFEAGADYFKPEQKPASGPNRGRAQSGSRSRGRSPVKLRPIDPKFAQPPPVPETTTESPGGTKFSSEEWKEIFKPQTFAPPSIPARPSPGRKRTSVPRPTMGTAAVVDESEASDEKPFFAPKPAAPSPQVVPSPDAMDVDTPPATHTVPPFTANLNIKTEQLKRPAGPSPSQSPIDTEALKVSFDDLKLKDIISSLNLPTPPEIPSAPQQPSPYERYTMASYVEFRKQFATYMDEWASFNKKFMLHLVARQIQVDNMGEEKTENDRVIEKYRQGLREDTAVLNHWQGARVVHEKVMKEYAIIRERMKTREEREGMAIGEAANGTPRQRKKTH